MTADLDTRCGGLYASGSEVLPAGKADNEDAAAAAGGGRCPAGDSAGVAAFAASRERFESLIGFLDGAAAAGLSHAELEEHLDVHGRELLRCLFDDHLALRAVGERRLEQVTGDEGWSAAGWRRVMFARLRRCSGRCRWGGWPIGRRGWGICTPPTRR